MVCLKNLSGESFFSLKEQGSPTQVCKVSSEETIKLLEPGLVDREELFDQNAQQYIWHKLVYQHKPTVKYPDTRLIIWA